jgi:hypothetical protein
VLSALTAGESGPTFETEVLVLGVVVLGLIGLVLAGLAALKGLASIKTNTVITTKPRKAMIMMIRLR